MFNYNNLQILRIFLHHQYDLSTMIFLIHYQYYKKKLFIHFRPKKNHKIILIHFAMIFKSRKHLSMIIQLFYINKSWLI